MAMVITASAANWSHVPENKLRISVPMTFQPFAATITTIPESLFMEPFWPTRRILYESNVWCRWCYINRIFNFHKKFLAFFTASLLLIFHITFWQYKRPRTENSVRPNFKAKAISYIFAGRCRTNIRTKAGEVW
jgi:hypothetical protein